MQYINFSAANRLQPDFSSPSFSIKYVLYFLYFKKKARTALTSGGVEPVMDSGGGGHSVFAKFFLSLLEENEEVIDATQLFSQLRRNVIDNSLQTPEYGNIHQAGHEGGDFLFVRQ